LESSWLSQSWPCGRNIHSFHPIEPLNRAGGAITSYLTKKINFRQIRQFRRRVRSELL
jgi:hypothetical protein